MKKTANPRIELRSDNSAGVASEVIAAVAAANVGASLAYGADPWTARLRTRVVDEFEQDEVEVFPVATGTAANVLGLSAIAPRTLKVIFNLSA